MGEKKTVAGNSLEEGKWDRARMKWRISMAPVIKNSSHQIIHNIKTQTLD